MAVKYIVRHGTMRFLGEYEANEGETYLRAEDVILRSERGLELGQVLCEANPRAVQLLAEPTHGRVVRRLTDEDQASIDRYAQRQPDSSRLHVGLRQFF